MTKQDAVITKGGYTQEDVQNLLDRLGQAGVLIHTTCDAFVCHLVVDDFRIEWSEPDGLRLQIRDGDGFRDLPSGLKVKSITFGEDFPVVTFAPVAPVKRRLRPAHRITPCGGGGGP